MIRSLAALRASSLALALLAACSERATPTPTLAAQASLSGQRAVLGDERALGTPVDGPAAGDQAAPAVACSGSAIDAVCLTVWQDARNGLDTDIFGVIGPLDLVSTQFAPMAPIAVSAATSDQSTPTVSWNGTQFIVAWADSRGGSGSDIYAARVGDNGTVLDPDGIVVCTNAGNQSHPAVASNGTSSLIVWQDDRSGSYSDIYGMRIGSDGTLLDGASIAISTAPLDQVAPAVASDGTGFLAVWQDKRDSGNPHIHGARIRADGTVLDEQGIVINTEAGYQQAPTVTWGRQNYLAVWSDNRNVSTTGIDVFGALVDPTSSAVSGVAAIGVGLSSDDAPSVTWQAAQSTFLVVWQSGDGYETLQIHGRPVSDSFADVSAGDLIVINSSLGLHSAPAASGALVAWMDDRSGPSDIYGTRIKFSAAMDPEGVLLSIGRNTEASPSVACDAAGACLAVWQDTRSGTTDIYGELLDATGAPTGEPFALCAASGNQRSATVAWDGAQFLVAWADQRDYYTAVWARRVAVGSGATLSAEFLVQASSYFRGAPALACDASTRTCLVASSGYDSDTSSYALDVDRIVDGVSGASVAVPAPAGAQHNPALAWGADRFLLAWEGYSGSDPRVLAARILRDGTLLDSNPIALLETAVDGAAQTVPAVAFDGTDFVLVWQDASAGATNLYTRRVSADGTALTSSRAVAASGDLQSLPALTCLATECLVVWQQEASGKTALVGARIAGDVTLESGLAMAAEVTSLAGKSLARAGDRGALVAYQRFASEAWGAWAFARTLGLDASPVAESGSATLDEDATEVELALSASDPDGDPLTFSLSSPPLHGEVQIRGDKAYFTPDADSHGADHFRFTASDGLVASEPATFAITVSPVNDGPTTFAITATALEDRPTTFALSAADVDGDSLDFTVATQPAHGTVTLAGGQATYTPAPDYSGSDRFSFVASDGVASSDAATATLSIAPVNDAPVATPQALEVVAGAAVTITLSASDADGDALSFAVASQPRHGTLVGPPPSLTYTADSAAEGPDSFTFTARDGSAPSTAAPVQLTLSGQGAGDM
ncbi:MAG: tandem-95 repeat protein, partial [Deltaproteobacteria bacterium]|nr:tandem-95 repeat protein [Deltaproteobacteria bacterium]